jgi:hypothetical protein
MSRWPLIAFLLLAGCFNPDYGDGTLQCAPGGVCPDGYACISGRCYRGGRDLALADLGGLDMPPDIARVDMAQIDMQPDMPQIDMQPDMPQVDMQPDMPHVVDMQPDMPHVVDMKGDMAIISYPPRTVWLSSGGGSVRGQTYHVNLSLGGSVGAGSTVNANNKSTLDIGFFAAGRIH